MNIKNAAKKLAKIYEEEQKSIPLVPLSNGAIGYKNYVVKQNSKGRWCVYLVNGKHLDFIDSFNLKSSACMAAKYYYFNNIIGTQEIHNLDSGYWYNHIDSEIFKYRFKTAQSSDRRDIFLCRWELTSQRAKFYKQKITAAFTHAFR